MILTAENYYSTEANKEYLSVSQYKDFVFGCEAKAIAKLNGTYKEEKTDALLIGSYVDTWCEGTLDAFKSEYADYIYSKSSKKEKVLLAKFQKAEDVINVIQNDKKLMKALEGEKQKIFTSELFGTKWKIKMDNYNPNAGFFSDLKVMASLYNRFYNSSTRTYENFVDSYGYNIQMAIYATIEKIVTNREKYLEPYLVVVTKEDPSDKAILKGFLQDIDLIMFDIENNIPRILALKNGEIKPNSCGKCDYCRQNKEIKIMDYRLLLED
jgi:hypothetical protein